MPSASGATTPRMATAANETRQIVWLLGSASDSRLMRPGKAQFSVTASARRRCLALRRHSACRVCTTMSQRPSSVLIGANAW